MSEWKEYKLGELVETLDNQRIPLSSMERAQRKGIYRYYGAQGVIDYIDSYIFDGKYMLVAEDGNNIKERKENIALIAEGKYWVNNHAHILKSNGKCDLDLVCYIINQMDISGFVTGTAQPKLNQANLMKLPLYLPDLPTQQRIASILSSLDAKIENNNKINAKLEEIAQNLFKEWFVDFGPFKNGKFVESELGLIPEGWRVVSLANLCDTISETKKFTTEEIIFLNTGDVENGLFSHNRYSLVDGLPGQAKKTIRKGDILYSEIRPINRHFAFVQFDADNYVVSTKLMVIRCRNVINSRRLYQYLTSDDVIAELQVEAESRSGTFPQIRFENIQRLKIVVATSDIEDKFSKIIENIYEKIDATNAENTKLATLRDTLLPKLMSGEIEV